MRVTLLAAIMICATAKAASAQPSKMNPLADGAATPVDTHPPLTVAVPVAEPIESANVQVSEIDVPVMPVASVANALLQPRKMHPELSPVLPVLSISLQPSKMNPGVAGLTGAMRYADSPWLDHAIDDLGTNPTGWKRLWCARSLNLWLQQSGKRGCGGDSAISCLEAGRRLPGPQVGAIAVLKHHVGIVKEIQDRHVVLVSGNNRGRPGARTVGISKYARASVVGYVWPE
jgi:hypothetical protein